MLPILRARTRKIAIVTLMTFFPTFVSTLRGLLSVTPQSLELMRSYAATERQIFLKLRLPHSVPMMKVNANPSRFSDRHALNHAIAKMPALSKA